jgi:hypothetical protein
MAANDNPSDQNDVFKERKSPLKEAFQWAGAVAATFSCEPPQNGYNSFGYAYDYYKAKLGARHAPKG